MFFKNTIEPNLLGRTESWNLEKISSGWAKSWKISPIFLLVSAARNSLILVLTLLSKKEQEVSTNT